MWEKIFICDSENTQQLFISGCLIMVINKSSEKYLIVLAY